MCMTFYSGTLLKKVIPPFVNHFIPIFLLNTKAILATMKSGTEIMLA